MCRCVSTKPGITIVLEPSITSALGALMFGRIAEILVPSISTSACSKSPTARSTESTQPPLIRIDRPGCARGAVCAPALVTLAASAGAAVTAAAAVQRNCRRDGLGGEQQGQPELKAWVMVASRCYECHHAIPP